MKNKSIIKFVKDIWYQSTHHKYISAAVKNRLENILREVWQRWDDYNTEFLVSTILENGRVNSKENQNYNKENDEYNEQDESDYYDIIVKVCQKIDSNLYHALWAAYEKDTPWMIFDHIDRDNPWLQKWEILAAKNHLEANQYYINPLNQPIPKWHITGIEFCRYFQSSEIIHDIYLWKSYHHIYIQKMLNCIIFIIWSNNDTDKVFDNLWNIFDLCLPKETLFDRIRDLTRIQMESIADISQNLINIDILSNKIEMTIKDINRYLKIKKINIYQKEEE